MLPSVSSHEWQQIIWVSFKHNVLFKSESVKKSRFFLVTSVLDILHFILKLQSSSVA